MKWERGKDFEVVNWKYRLSEDRSYETGLELSSRITTEFVDLSPTGKLTLRKGYAWDGASGPAIDTSDFMRGSAFHDAFYQLMREGLLPRTYRKFADQLMRRINREDGMGSEGRWYQRLWGKFRLRYTYWGVRIFGAEHMNGKLGFQMPQIEAKP